MKRQPDDFKTTYARLKAWRDRLHASRKSPRPATTPLALSFSKKSKPRKRGRGNEEG